MSLFLANFSNAQPIDCEQCTSGPVQYAEYDLCTFTADVQWTMADGSGIQGTTSIVDAPLVKVFIQYRIQICPDGTQSLLIEDCVYLDETDCWNNEFMSYYDQFGTLIAVATVDNPPVVDPTFVNNCIYSIHNTNPPIDKMNLAIDEAIDRLLQDVGVTSQGLYTVFRKASCYSTVTLRFPAGSFIVSKPNDYGQTTTQTFSLANATIMQNIPCNEICCRYLYKWEVITLSNGETRSIWTKVSTNSNGGECENQPMPNYYTYEHKLVAKGIMVGSGDTTEHIGLVVGQTPCTSTCLNITEPPPSEALIIKEKEKTVADITLTPSVNAEFLTINSEKRITNIMVYGINGQKLEQGLTLKNNKLYISTLKDGIYLLRLYFDDNSYQTLKFVK